MDQGFVKAAVIEYHNLMDHSEFQVRFRIINGKPAVLDHGDLNKKVDTDYAVYQSIIFPVIKSG